MGDDLFEPIVEPPELYSDSMRIGVGPYGFVMDFGIGGVADTLQSEQPPVKLVARVRMSPQHALIFSKLLQRNVTLYQEQNGKINLPEALYKSLGLEPE